MQLSWQQNCHIRKLCFSEDYFSDEIPLFGKVISAGINEGNVDEEGSIVVTNVYTTIESVDVVIENADHTFSVDTQTEKKGDYCEKADYAELSLLNSKKEGYCLSLILNYLLSESMSINTFKIHKKFIPEPFLQRIGFFDSAFCTITLYISPPREK